jgi:hypothetical protein
MTRRRPADAELAVAGDVQPDLGRFGARDLDLLVIVRHRAALDDDLEQAVLDRGGDPVDRRRLGQRDGPPERAVAPPASETLTSLFGTPASSQRMTKSSPSTKMSVAGTQTLRPVDGSCAESA